MQHSSQTGVCLLCLKKSTVQRHALLNLQTTYAAILTAARSRKFISYGELAEANNEEWKKVRLPLPGHLDKLIQISAQRKWPIITAIVVNQGNVGDGSLEGAAADGFIRCAIENGYEVTDPAEFIKAQQQEVFDWAPTAPDSLELEEPVDQEAPSSSTRVSDEGTRYWFAGANWDNTDQTEHFVREGIWKNGHEDKFTEQVAQMKAGDRIAIKSTFVQKKDLPFENNGVPVSCMRIKAVGTIVEPTSDGMTVKVEWTVPDEQRDWYLYTYRWTLVEADTSVEDGRRLVRFAFNNEDQDYDYWLRKPYWKKKYGTANVTQTDIEREEEEARADLETADSNTYSVDDIISDGAFLSKAQLNAALERLQAKKNLILQGPPGTGKTWLAKRLGYALIGTNDGRVTRKRVRVIQFHPSLSYEDFVRGWRPDGAGQLSLLDGVFLDAVEAARAEPDRPFVFVIEEINRGNPAQIFGEMLTLLEADKRNEMEAIELAYSNAASELVYIPKNLYVIGTMNIADRSLALVDLALRRRFAFVDLLPTFNGAWMRWCRQAGIDTGTIEVIQRKMHELNAEISNDRSLGEQFQVGHSYVTPRPGEKIENAKAWFQQIVHTEIGPLLNEYWYDNRGQAEKAQSALLEGL